MDCGIFVCRSIYWVYNWWPVRNAKNEKILKDETRHTNADRIRNMSDEELAEFLAVHDLGLKGNDLPMLTDWLEWLQLEAE